MKKIKKTVVIITVLTLILQMLIPILPIFQIKSLATKDIGEEIVADLEISTKEELIKFANDVNSGNDYKGKTVVLTENIDLGKSSWNPIGNKDNRFAGIFDGNGHTISNLYINSALVYQGLFGYNSGEILNLNITNSEINVTSYKKPSGGYYYSHYIGMITGYNIGNIENCMVNSSKISININNGTELVNIYAGLIAGNLESIGTIIRCTSNGELINNLQGSNTYATTTLGGIAGNGNSGRIEKCINNSKLVNSNTQATNYLGGIVGKAIWTEIYDSWNKGNITSGTVFSRIGGFMATAQNVSIKNCINSGNITSSGTGNVTATYNQIGGFIGVWNSENKIYNSYNIGKINNGGAIVGHGNGGGEISNTYYLSGSASSSIFKNGITGNLSINSKSQVEMQSSNFVIQLNNGDDYFTSDIENMNNGYPLLIWMVDRTGPSGEIKYSTQDPTNGDVTVTITSNEQVQEIEGWKLSEDKLILTKTYNQNITETIIIRDLIGNETEVNIEITNIDKTAPTLNVEYSTQNPTKGNVKVTITSDEELQSVTGWTLSSDKRTLTKEYSANTKETITVKDLAGNEKQATIEIKNIDKTGPSVNVEYSTKNPTRENIIVTITSNEEIESITGWELLSDKKTLTKEYGANTKETITVKDLAGNEKQATIEINNIDKTGPSVNVEYSTQNPTKGNVKVTITSNEEVQSVTGWTLSSDKKILTKEYSANTKETVTIKDLAGNEKQATIEINNIDKTGPSVNVEYSTKNPTRENVIVTITANEEIQGVIGWTLSSDKKTLTKEYSANTKETIAVKDLAGNETQVNVEISNIDKSLIETIVGDINQDEKIDVTDFLMIKRHLVAGNRDIWKLTGDNLSSADMNENGTVDITDMLMLKKVLVDEM